MQLPGWHYDELRQVGVDFDSIDQVAAYDAKQGSNLQAELTLIERLGIAPGAVVVDLGCGTASFALAAPRHGARVLAVDISQAMLDHAQGKANAEHLSEIEFHRAGFLTFDPRPDAVDFIVTRFALHHLPDFWKQVALIRLAAMLRPKGKLFLRDVSFSFPPREYERAISEWVERMPRISGYARAEFETHVREEHSTFAWVLEGMLERAGFEIVESLRPAAEYAEWVCSRS